MKGFFNRLLRINLEQKSFDYEEISDEILRQTLGGKGLGTHLLMEENPKGVEADRKLLSRTPGQQGCYAT